VLAAEFLREEEVFVCVDLVYLQKNGFNIFAKMKKMVSDIFLKV